MATPTLLVAPMTKTTGFDMVDQQKLTLKREKRMGGEFLIWALCRSPSIVMQAIKRSILTVGLQCAVKEH